MLYTAAAARPTHTSQSSRSRHSGIQDSQQPKEELSDESQFIAELKPRLEFKLQQL